MVGVPGKSKGCHACRKRKIGCSLERPECLICRNSGRKCPGYARETVFVHSDLSRRDGRNRQDRSFSARHSVPSDLIQNGRQQSSLALPQQVRSLEATASRLDLFSQFLPEYTEFKYYNHGAHGSWLTASSHNSTASSCLESVATAFCLSRLGRQSGDSQFLGSSLEQYTRGLRELQKALRDPLYLENDQLLATCLLCVMFEVFECPGKSQHGYQSHLDGCAALVEARGVDRTTFGLDHWTFTTFRFMSALQSLASKKTFLSKPEWMVIPFSVTPKSPFDQLVDLLLEAPSLLSRADQLQALTDPQVLLSTAVSLFQSCYDLDVRRQQFMTDLNDQVRPTQLYWELPQPIHMSHSKILPARMVLSPQYWFFDGRIAQLMLLYWAMTTMLHSGMCHLQILIAGLGGHVAVGLAELASEEYLAEITGFPNVARNIFRSLHFCLSGETGTFGISALIAPVNIVKDVLSDWPGTENDIRMAKAVLSIVQAEGFAITKYI